MQQRRIHDPYPYFLYNAYLARLCRERGLTLHAIGRAGQRTQYSISKIVINDIARPQATLCFAAGIHGDETSGPLAMLSFLERLNVKKLKGLKLILLPLCNPYGFDRNQRRGFYGTDLNRRWTGKNLKNEQKLLYSATKKEKIDFFVSFHEDDVEKSFYFYAYHDSGTEQPIHRVIRDTARKFLPISGKKMLYGHRAGQGIVFNKYDTSFESRMRRDGVPDSGCIEVPDSLPFGKRVQLTASIMEAVTRFYARESR